MQINMQLQTIWYHWAKVKKRHNINCWWRNSKTRTFMYSGGLINWRWHFGKHCGRNKNLGLFQHIVNCFPKMQCLMTSVNISFVLFLYIHNFIYTLLLYIPVYLYIHIHIFILTYYTYLYIYIYSYTYIYLYIHMYLYIFLYIYTILWKIILVLSFSF